MIFSKFERLMAKRYLRAKRKEGFISVITGFAFTGIALGVATLIIVMSVMNGFREELLSRILGINGHIGIVSSIGMPFNNYQQAAKEIAEFDNVKTVIPMIENQLLVSAGKAAEGAMIRGISKDDLLKKDILRDSIKNINPEDFGGNNVIVGVRLANKMGIVPGDEITLISPNGKVTAFGTVPRMKSYKVLGTFEVGMFEYDSNFIFMPLEAAQVYFGLPGAVTNIDVTLDDDKMVKPVRKAIEESIGAGAYVYDWKQSNSAFFNAIDVERNVMFIILTLIIIVAAFNIITGLIVLFFGLHFLGVFKLPLFKGTKAAKTDNLGFFSSILFGIVFSIGWTPCVGAFLGSALMLATSQGNVAEGVVMLLFYSLGLGIPFFLSALLIDRLKGAFSFIKKHYRIINIVSGVFLVIIGVLMATGLLGRFLALLS